MDPEDAFAEEPRKSMEGLPFPAPGGGGSTSSSSSNRNGAPLPGPGYPALDAGEPSAKPCLPPSVSSAATASPFSYGCFPGGAGGGGGGGGGGGYYSYRVARSALKPGPMMPPQPGYPEKYLEVCNVAAAEDYPTRPAEFAFYPGYGGPYQPVASYLDVSVVGGGAAGEARHEALLPVDPYHEPWALAAGGWSGPVCCAKEPSPAAGHFWKTAFAEAVGQHPAEACTFRRGRKKRIPYSKGQLKELEKEYSSSKFITKDKRRKISAATNLSERQITIWFQNRRVKEKKVVAKVKSASANSTANSTSDTP